jgi:hypothetical protein
MLFFAMIRHDGPAGILRSQEDASRISCWVTDKRGYCCQIKEPLAQLPGWAYAR